MADKIKIPFTNTDGLINEEIGTLIKASDSDLGCDMIYRNDDDTVTIPRDVLGEWYFNSFRKKVAPVFNKAVKNLLNIRNHLLLQLDLECGNISEEYFDKEESNYLTETGKISFEKLREEVKILFGFTDLPLDSEDISEILNCSVDNAEEALKTHLDGS